jgi:NADH:ubiquinone oxidoreductase subunit 6 (subunit J)
MTPFAVTPNPPAAGQLALAMLLAAAGVFLLLPKPRTRSVVGGTFALLGAAAVLGAWCHRAFGDPASDWIGKLLFILFSTGAVGFGCVLVVQRNPARGALAFAFVVLSTCGLFLLLAAPFLMAVTVIVYAGAIIVTFLFVLMLSHVSGPADENDRSREPLLGSLAGFAFAGLVLFALHQTELAARPPDPADAKAGAKPEARLPLPVLTAEERRKLADVSAKLRRADDELVGDVAARRAELGALFDQTEDAIEEVAQSVRNRTQVPRAKLDEAPRFYRDDPQARAVRERTAALRRTMQQTFDRVREGNLNTAKPDVDAARADLRKLREEADLLYGAGELPARNVANLGLLLYADHLLAVELAGMLLLVATIGAVAIAQRKREGAPPA